MKTTVLWVLGTLGAPMILAGPAPAGFVGLTLIHKPNPYALTWNVYAQFDERPGDFVSAVAGTPLSPLNVNVRGGTFYQHPANTHGGGDLPPDPALFGTFPSLEFDTFVTIGRKTSDANTRPGINLAPNWPGFGPERLAFDVSGWFTTPSDLPCPSQPGCPIGYRVLLMQLSTQDGVGFFGTILVNGFSNGLDLGSIPAGADVNGYVSFDTQQASAPAGLAVLGIAGLLGSGRRRSP